MLSNIEAVYFNPTLHHLAEGGNFLFGSCFKISIQNLKDKVHFFNSASFYNLVVHQENWKRAAITKIGIH